MKRLYFNLLTISTIVLILSIVARTITTPGYIYFRDVTENINVSDLYQRYIYTYSNDIGEALAEKARIPLFYLIFGVFKFFNLLGLGNEYYVKIKIFLLFIFSFLAFFGMAKKFVKKYLDNNASPNSSSLHLLLPPLIGAIFYVTNFWFTNRVAHFGLFFTTVTVPVCFYLLFDYFFSENKKVYKLILLAVLLGVFTATPHTILFEILIFLAIFITYLVNKKNSKDKLLTLFLHLWSFAGIILLINLYWLLPYLVSNSKPDAEVSESIVNLIGKYATFKNSVGLMGYWLTEPNQYFSSKDYSPIAFTPLFFSIASLIVLVVKKYYKVFSVLLILLIAGVFLSTSSSLTNAFYFKLMFNSPLKNYGWIFREYDKFGLLTAFAYSVLITCLSYFVLKVKRLWLVATIPYALIITLNIYFLNLTMETNYKPVQIPESFFAVVKEISQDRADFNILWYPGTPSPFWTESEEVRFTFTNLISPKPPITTRSEIINYANFLFNPENIYSIDMGKALDIMGVKYLIIRNDDSVFKSVNIDDLLSNQTSLKILFSDDLLTLYENTSFSGIGNLYTSKISTNMGLKFLKQDVANMYNNSTTLIDYTDKPSHFDLPEEIVLKPKDGLDITLSNYSNKFIYPSFFSFKKEDGNPGYWKTGSLENINHAEVDFFLERLGLNIKQFDFGRGVVMARDGWQLEKSLFEKGTSIPITFSKHKNLDIENGQYHYYSINDDFKYYWNPIKSDEFNVSGMSAIGVALNSTMEEKLSPHFKLTFLGDENTILGIVTMYQDERGVMQSIVKVPSNARKAIFSIWGLSMDQNNHYSYTLKNVVLKDLSGVAKPISLGFNTKSNCVGNCSLYARSLKSTIGGELGISINNNNFTVPTKTPETMRNDRFQWDFLGKVSDIGEEVFVNLENKEGFNSVNALVLLNEEEIRLVEQESTLINLSSGPETLKMENTSNLPHISVTQINPAKYIVKITNATGEKAVIGLDKPFSANWILYPNNIQAKILNGYTNGWEFEKLTDGTYYIEYKPQKYLEIGIIISGATLLMCTTFLTINYFRRVSALDLKSNSQG